MKNGRKPGSPAAKRAAGTYQPSRHAGLVEVKVPGSLPQAPHWLTKAGQNIWLDLIPRISVSRAGCELDSDLIATLANLIGATGDCWGAGEVPPAAHLAELRRLCELFGLAGVTSRVISGGQAPAELNPFTLLMAKKLGR